MRNSQSYDPKEFDDLLRQIDGLLEEPDEKPAVSGGDIDLTQFTPADAIADEGEIYQNFSNGYGASQPEQPDSREQHRRSEYRDYGGTARRTTAARKAGAAQRKRRGKGCGCGCATALAVIAALAAALMLFIGSFFEIPTADGSLGTRKENTAAILLCGTDKDGTRTDTMMLIYLDGNENRVGLLSLPRDTLTRTGSGKRAKLNSAYGRNGCGEEGMEWTLTYVERIIGYRPDGYILVDMELVPKVVDLMGGVNVTLDHHIRVHTDGVEVYVPAGEQHLNGEEVLATLRYRYGYADADLGRVKVQRMVINECMKQWVTPANLEKLPEVLELIERESLTNLEMGNYLWIGKTILTSADNLTSDTLPGYADMRGGASYYILYPEKVAELINESYNPYTADIDVDDLQIEE